MALGTGDRRGLNTWLARLPMEAKEKDEWRYWQADLLLERGREAEAKEICINSCNSVVSTRWLQHNASAKSMS